MFSRLPNRANFRTCSEAPANGFVHDPTDGARRLCPDSMTVTCGRPSCIRRALYSDRVGISREVRSITDFVRELSDDDLQTEEAFMTLIVLDPRKGERVILTIRDKPSVQQPQPAQVVTPASRDSRALRFSMFEVLHDVVGYLTARLLLPIISFGWVRVGPLGSGSARRLTRSHGGIIVSADLAPLVGLLFWILVLIVCILLWR